MTWTPERIAELIRLVEAGESRGEIAKAMGISRNAVIGKAARMGLPDMRKDKARQGIVRSMYVRSLLKACDDLERECVKYFRRKEAGAWRRTQTRMCADPHCWNTRQPGRTHCAQHLPVPTRTAGWTGMGRASGGSSLL